MTHSLCKEKNGYLIDHSDRPPRRVMAATALDHPMTAPMRTATTFLLRTNDAKVRARFQKNKKAAENKRYSAANCQR
ncbi:MAG: hypothetical protein IT425_11470 [Pirellulales bacterium]|nr:hypothetical protein [Pirellulales bacterium]